VRPCIKSVVVTFNPDIPLFERCLASVANLCEIIVVDNGSSNVDEIRELLRRFPNSRLIELGANYGVNVAANVGIESAKDADWVLFLDQDTIVLCDPAEVVDLARRSYTKKDVGLISLSRERELRYGYGQIFFEYDFPIFAGSLVRNELLERGLRFDESFFMDAGDTDFSWRVRQMGYAVVATSRICRDQQHGIEGQILGMHVEYHPAWRLYLRHKGATRLLIRKEIPFALWTSIFVGDLVKYLVIRRRPDLAFLSTVQGFIDGAFGRRTNLHLMRLLAKAENRFLGDVRVKY